MRVVEDPRGLGAEIIDKYDVVIVVFEGRDGYFDKAVGFGAETDAALLRFVHDRARASSGSTARPRRRTPGATPRSTT